MVYGSCLPISENRKDFSGVSISSSGGRVLQRQISRFSGPLWRKPTAYDCGITLAQLTAGHLMEEEVFEYCSRLDGRLFSCLYKSVFSDRHGCYLVKMVPGSLRWSDDGNKANQG